MATKSSGFEEDRSVCRYEFGRTRNKTKRRPDIDYGIIITTQIGSSENEFITNALNGADIPEGRVRPGNFHTSLKTMVCELDT